MSKQNAKCRGRMERAEGRAKQMGRKERNEGHVYSWGCSINGKLGLEIKQTQSDMIKSSEDTQFDRYRAYHNWRPQFSATVQVLQER